MCDTVNKITKSQTTKIWHNNRRFAEISDCKEISFMNSFLNIYTPSVFCYDEHKNNFDIHFSMKKHT